MKNNNTSAGDYCSTLKQRADRCYRQHYRRYGGVIGTPAFEAVRERVRTSNSACFRLAMRVVRECGEGVSISPPRVR